MARMRWHDVNGATYISPGAAAVLARRAPTAAPPRPKPVHVHLYGDLAAAYAGGRRARDQKAEHELEPADPRNPRTGVGPEAAGFRDQEGITLRPGDRLTVGADCGPDGFSLMTTGAADEGLDELGHNIPDRRRAARDAALLDPGRPRREGEEVEAVRAWQRLQDEFWSRR